jgi:hypothetical protein
MAARGTIRRLTHHVAPAVLTHGGGLRGIEPADCCLPNMELLTDYSCPGGRAAVTRPVVTSGRYL